MKLQKETKIHGRWYNDACGTAFGMELLGERWSLLILRELMFGALRFSDIRASLPGISAKSLTERLESLEAAGALHKRRLPPPVSAQVYELTQWGKAAEPVVIELGRWAAQSPLHDPTLPLSPVSFMLSLRTMFDASKAGGWRARIGFVFPHASFVASVADGDLPVERVEPEGCDATFVAPDGPALAAHFYLGMSAQELGIEIAGDLSIATRFTELFELPPKLSLA